MLQELFWRQIARLPPIEDRLGDIRRKIAEAEQARQTQRSRPLGPVLQPAAVLQPRGPPLAPVSLHWAAEQPVEVWR